MLEFLASNMNMTSHTIGFLIPNNQSSLGGNMNESIFYIKVPTVTEKANRGEKERKRGKKTNEMREK